MGRSMWPQDAALAAREDELFELGVKAAKFIRAKFPQLKIIAGNSGGSSGMIAVMLRRGFPRELIDYLGSETTGQTFAPEKLIAEHHGRHLADGRDSAEVRLRHSLDRLL